MRHPRDLRATYRLQLTPSFGFKEAAAVADHVARLGVSHAYLSPIFEARPGSEHGYDVVDPRDVRRELGGEEAFLGLVEALRGHGLGILLDIVPNHLSTYSGGTLWRDVLRHGPGSEYAGVFDIDWGAGSGAVILPILAEPLEKVRAEGGLALEERDGEHVLCYLATDLPLRPDGPAGGAPLDEILDAQHYRLSYWKDPARNYRRFFTIDDLVGVRVEDARVFEMTHGLVRRLVEDDLVDALRVDHIDGLADPAGYLARLARLAGDRPIFVEKILTGDEPLRRSWPVAGTTGYEVADDITNALADPAGIERLQNSAADAGEDVPEDAIAVAKRFVVESFFTSEVEKVAGLTRLGTEAVKDAVVAMPVYRSYVSSRGVEDDLDVDLLLLAGGERLYDVACDPDERRREGIIRFQQLTGAAMAKGVEDTAWYRLVGKLPFFEVGGDPEHSPQRDEDAISRLHRRSRRRLSRAERPLIPGTTHDTKRSADVRARLLALAEVAPFFEGGLEAFADAMPARPVGDDRPPVPGPLERRRIAETCLAMAPFEPAPAEEWDLVSARVGEALRKGAREAKARDSWEEVNEAYEEALTAAAGALLSRSGRLLFECFGAIVERVQRFGATLSLSQVVLRSSLPGLPDCYQGDEGWNFCLVDPDNRRPVDYGRLRAAYERAVTTTDDLGALAYRDDALKVLVTHRCLAARRALPGLFAAGRQVPLGTDGLTEGAENSVISFAREDASDHVLVLATKAPHRLAVSGRKLPAKASYGEGRLALTPLLRRSTDYLEVISGRSVRAERDGIFLADALATLPVAILVPEGAVSRDELRSALAAPRPPA